MRESTAKKITKLARTLGCTVDEILNQIEPVKIKKKQKIYPRVTTKQTTIFNKGSKE